MSWRVLEGRMVKTAPQCDVRRSRRRTERSSPTRATPTPWSRALSREEDGAHVLKGTWGAPPPSLGIGPTTPPSVPADHSTAWQAPSASRPRASLALALLSPLRCTRLTRLSTPPYPLPGASTHCTVVLNCAAGVRGQCILHLAAHRAAPSAVSRPPGVVGPPQASKQELPNYV